MIMSISINLMINQTPYLNFEYILHNLHKMSNPMMTLANFLMLWGVRWPIFFMRNNRAFCII